MYLMMQQIIFLKNESMEIKYDIIKTTTIDTMNFFDAIPITYNNMKKI